MQAPFPTVLSYDTDPSDGFGEPKNVTINGQPVTAVKSLVIRQTEKDYNEVELIIRGVHVVSNGSS